MEMNNILLKKLCIHISLLILLAFSLDYLSMHKTAFAQFPFCVTPFGTLNFCNLLPNRNPPSFDLTGTYSCDDGGTYYIRQIGFTIFWVGMSSDNGKSFTNVFHGTIQGNDTTINGLWADVPLGRFYNSGTLTLAINHDNSLQKIGESGGSFTGSSWQRL